MPICISIPHKEVTPYIPQYQFMNTELPYLPILKMGQWIPPPIKIGPINHLQIMVQLPQVLLNVMMIILVTTVKIIILGYNPLEGTLWMTTYNPTIGPQWTLQH